MSRYFQLLLAFSLALVFVEARFGGNNERRLQDVMFSAQMPTWRRSSRFPQVQGFMPVASFSDIPSRPLFFGSWRKRIAEDW
ncbi:unnamed protein product [Caenorhabditis auriculariae]|uniref:Uncharacterized protein n=1 Tax=Caenorhabditis auriculariae TaxID=2777116 RepID=A0A8S1HMP2_9PELO|nr:unnamed protein product [Caenorhabditis auriculariae]